MLTTLLCVKKVPSPKRRTLVVNVALHNLLSKPEVEPQGKMGIWKENAICFGFKERKPCDGLKVLVVNLT